MPSESSPTAHRVRSAHAPPVAANEPPGGLLLNGDAALGLAIGGVATELIGVGVVLPELVGVVAGTQADAPAVEDSVEGKDA